MVRPSSPRAYCRSYRNSDSYIVGAMTRSGAVRKSVTSSEFGTIHVQFGWATFRLRYQHHHEKGAAWTARRLPVEPPEGRVGAGPMGNGAADPDPGEASCRHPSADRDCAKELITTRY